MLMNFKSLLETYNMNIKGVVHIGAHYGNEVEEYVDNGIQDIILFEPMSKTFDQLKRNMREVNANISAYQVALGSKIGTGIININDNNSGQSSSLLKPKQHLVDHPWVTFNGTEEVEIDILDNYDIGESNLINIDVQGYELEVFKGALNTLKKIDYIITEVNRAEMYENNVMVQELDLFLSEYGFERVETFWPDTWYNWGDALYVKVKK